MRLSGVHQLVINHLKDVLIIPSTQQHTDNSEKLHREQNELEKALELAR